MQKELLSAYMDGEEVSAELTEQLCQDKDSQESWAAYHTVRAVMRKESPVLLGADFTAKMADLTEKSPKLRHKNERIICANCDSSYFDQNPTRRAFSFAREWINNILNHYSISPVLAQ